MGLMPDVGRAWHVMFGALGKVTRQQAASAKFEHNRLSRYGDIDIRRARVQLHVHVRLASLSPVTTAYHKYPISMHDKSTKRTHTSRDMKAHHSMSLRPCLGVSNIHILPLGNAAMR